MARIPFRNITQTHAVPIDTGTEALSISLALAVIFVVYMATLIITGG